MTLYASLAEVKRELKANITAAADDARLLSHIRQVSRRLDLMLSPQSPLPYFAPYKAQRQFQVRGGVVNSVTNTFDLQAWLLALESAAINDTVITSDATVFPNYPTSSPYHLIRYTGTSSWYTLCSFSARLQPSFVIINGTWGYNRNYPNAFIKYDDVTTTVVTPSATTITVADADGLDPFGLTPRFSPGQLLQIETEWLEVIAVNTVSNVLTVTRAVNGSALPAGNYATGVDIAVYQVDENIKRATVRQSAFLYAREGAFQSESNDGLGLITYPPDLLSELRGIVQGFQYV